MGLRTNLTTPNFSNIDFSLLVDKVNHGDHIHVDFTTSTLWERICNFFLSCFPSCRLSSGNAIEVFEKLERNIIDTLKDKAKFIQIQANEDETNLKFFQQKVDELQKVKEALKDPNVQFENSGRVLVNGEWISIIRPKTDQTMKIVSKCLGDYLRTEQFKIHDFKTIEEDGQLYLEVDYEVPPYNVSKKKVEIDIKNNNLWQDHLQGKNLEDYFLKEVHDYKNENEMQFAVVRMILHYKKECQKIEDAKSPQEKFQDFKGSLDDVYQLMIAVLNRKVKYLEKYPEKQNEYDKLNGLATSVNKNLNNASLANVVLLG